MKKRRFLIVGVILGLSMSLTASSCSANSYDSSMDYKLVKIWSANNRLYASFRYTKDDADNNICGDAINYEIDNTTNDFTKSIVYESELGDFKNQTRATIPMENGIYSWSNYKNYRIIRKDYIPGNYYIQSITIQYKLGPQTRLELSSGDLFSNNTIVSGNSEYSNYYVFNALKDKYSDLMKEGIIDPAMVLRVALQNAASVAGTLLTTSCIIVNDKSEECSCKHQGMPMQMPMV